MSEAVGQKNKVAVVAIGGNALTAEGQRGTAEEIEANAADMAEAIAELQGEGWRVVIVHGNGPQVGNLALQQEGVISHVPPQPLYTLNAMTQGQLGSVLVRAIDDHLGEGAAVAVLSHMIVDPTDPAFGDPTKPIGPFFTHEQAREFEEQRGWSMIEDSGRGYRRVVPSPYPQNFLEIESVRALLDSGKVVLAAGGGGLAVSLDSAGRHAGVDAVIDKDFAASSLAVGLDASALMLVTGVESVCLDFGRATQRIVHEMTTSEARENLDAGQFPPGSMGPKIKAAIDFVEQRGVGQGTTVAVITTAGSLARSLAHPHEVGTHIVPSTVMSSV